MATKTRAKRAKQGHLPGLEPPSNKKVDAAADLYYEAMTERCKLSKEESEAKDNLIDVMKVEGFESYTTPDGLKVTLTATSNVKCKPVKEESEGGDESEEA